MREEFANVSSLIEYFYKRTINVLIPSIEEIRGLLIESESYLKVIQDSIIDYDTNKDDFFAAMDLINDIKMLYSDFRCVYDIDGVSVTTNRIYLRKPAYSIKCAKEQVERIKRDPYLYNEGALKRAIEFLKKREEADILDVLSVLEKKLNPNIYVNFDYYKCISDFKEILISFNDLNEDDKENSYSNFCLVNIEENELLEDIENLYIDYKSVEDLMENFYYDFEYIVDWFSTDELKEIALIDSKAYFNVLNIINHCNDFLNDRTVDKATNLIKNLKDLCKEGLDIIS